jgi:hypothetical protein
MPRDAAILVACLFAACASFAVERQTPKKPNPISEALCGRTSSERARAMALDAFDFAAVPEAWRNAKVEELNAWLELPRCTQGAIAEYALFTRRREVLQTLHSRLERALAVSRFETALKDFPRWQKRGDEWPSAAECNGCDVLRRAAAAGMKVRAQWPMLKVKVGIGSLLDGADTRESLMNELCIAMPAARAREEMESRFRYYTWTARGAALVEVAQWFERPEVVAECRDAER